MRHSVGQSSPDYQSEALIKNYGFPLPLVIPAACFAPFPAREEKIVARIGQYFPATGAHS